MDLVYMPEILSYGTLRHPQYRDYEQPWNKDYFSYGKSTTKARTQYRQQSQKPASKKTPCLICKENKRRTLAAYIRGKARQNSCNEIHEEIEEEEEEEEVEVEGKHEEKAARVGDEEASSCRKEAADDEAEKSSNVKNNGK